MRYTFEEEFRLDHPETVGETDRHFDLDNYKDWLEAQLIEARKQLALYNVVGRSEQLPPNPITDKEHEGLMKALYPKDNSKRFRR